MCCEMSFWNLCVYVYKMYNMAIFYKYEGYERERVCGRLIWIQKSMSIVCDKFLNFGDMTHFSKSKCPLCLAVFNLMEQTFSSFGKLIDWLCGATAHLETLPPPRDPAIFCVVFPSLDHLHLRNSHCILNFLIKGSLIRLLSFLSLFIYIYIYEPNMETIN